MAVILLQVPPLGLEPRTYRLKGGYSNQLSYGGVTVPSAGIEPASFWSGRFSYHYSFRYRFRLWSGLYLYHSISTLGTRRLVSTPSHYCAWLGISS